KEKIMAIKERTEVVVLPEMFSTGFTMSASTQADSMDGETIAWMKEVSAEKKIILTGSVIIEEKGEYFNRLIWMLPNGQHGVYDKRHLFAYAGEDRQYTAGSKRLIASVKGWKINLLVCYDLRFPVWARQHTSPLTPLQGRGEQTPTSDGTGVNELEYDVLIYVANWPERRINAWKTLLQARAIENQCYVVGVNRIGDDGYNIHYTGESMVVDPMGEVLYQKKDVEDAFTITLDKEHLQSIRDKFPFWKDADQFVIND
ncbi:MAG: nitrilase family protein, partial [Chitinophagaceae bacterium]